MTTARWSDLPSRLYSALALIIVGFWAVFYGGLFLLFAVSILVSVMHFELAKMQSPHNSGAPHFSSLVGLVTLIILNYLTIGFYLFRYWCFHCSASTFYLEPKNWLGYFIR